MQSFKLFIFDNGCVWELEYELQLIAFVFVAKIRFVERKN